MKKMFFLLSCLYFFNAVATEPQMVTIAIIAQNRAHVLPLFLTAIENQTWPKAQTNIFIRTFDNTDETSELLSVWVDALKGEYYETFFDDSPLGSKKTGDLNQEAATWAHERNSHLCMVDSGMIISPKTITAMVEAQLPIIAPLLRTPGLLYSNYHACIDGNGYFKDCPLYHTLLSQSVKGMIEVPVVNGVYFVRYEALDSVSYSDGSARHDYVIFSHQARKNGLKQYLDTRSVYGYITFKKTVEDLAQEAWLDDFTRLQSSVPEINRRCNKIIAAQNKPSTEVFSEIYENKKWGSNSRGEGWSGRGSDVKHTTAYRVYLTDFLHQHDIKSVVDLGCGDWEFTHLIDWTGIYYRGYDAVESVINKNRKHYGSSNIHFEVADATVADLPEADLLICKDVLQHLTNSDIQAIIPRFKKFKYCLITNGAEPAPTALLNSNIRRGGYRPLDITRDPFNVKATKVLSGYTPEYRETWLIVNDNLVNTNKRGASNENIV